MSATKNPEGFEYFTRGGDVVITHHGRPATTLRGSRAADLLVQLDGLDQLAAQHVMARLTGNYRRGNERQARAHHRNR